MPFQGYLFRRERLLLVKVPRRRPCPHLASGRESLHLPLPDEPPLPARSFITARWLCVPLRGRARSAELALDALEIAIRARQGDTEGLVHHSDRGVRESQLPEPPSKSGRFSQRKGEFRRFDTQAMALFILSLRNGVIQRYHVKSDLDLDTIAREMTRLVDLRNPPTKLRKLTRATSVLVATSRSGAPRSSSTADRMPSLRIGNG